MQTSERPLYEPQEQVNSVNSVLGLVEGWMCNRGKFCRGDGTTLCL